MSARADDDRDEVRAHASAVAADLRQWLEWAQLTGADELPIDLDAAPAVRRAPAPAAPPRPAAPAAARAPAPVAPPAPSAPAATARPAPQAPRTPDSRPASTPVPRVSPRAAGNTAAPPPPTGAVPHGADGLAQVRAELGDCQRCRLAKGRKNLVYGIGSPTARLVLIGEAPGEQEDKTGEPFVGRSGQLLTRMLNAIGLQRDDVYICNVIKCRPPQNRDPLADEIATCSPFLHRQVAAIAPKAILTLGRYAAVNVLGRDASLGELRGQPGVLQGVPVVATYHPAYLLRTPNMKKQAWRDLLLVRGILRANPAADVTLGM